MSLDFLLYQLFFLLGLFTYIDLKVPRSFDSFDELEYFKRIYPTVPKVKLKNFTACGDFNSIKNGKSKLNFCKLPIKGLSFRININK
jgi:hypothetical protein